MPRCGVDTLEWRAGGGGGGPGAAGMGIRVQRRLLDRSQAEGHGPGQSLALRGEGHLGTMEVLGLSLEKETCWF